MRCDAMQKPSAGCLDSLAGRDLTLSLGLGTSIGGLAVAGLVAELNLLLDSSAGLVVVLLVLEHWGEIISIK